MVRFLSASIVGCAYNYNFCVPLHNKALKNFRSLLLGTDIYEHFVFPLLSFFKSALIGNPTDYVTRFQGAKTLAERDFFPLPDSCALVCCWFQVILRFTRFAVWLDDYKEVNLASAHSSETNWKNESCVGWFSYVSLAGNMLDISVQKVTTAYRMANDVPVRQLIGVVSVALKHWCTKTPEEMTHAVSLEPTLSLSSELRLSRFSSSKMRSSRKVCPRITDISRLKTTVDYLHCSMCKRFVKLTVCRTRVMFCS